MYQCKNINTALFAFLALVLIAVSCRQNTKQHQYATASTGEIYTCPMHPEIIRDVPGDCPICGMKLVKNETHNAKLDDIPLESLLNPTNAFVVSSVPVTSMHKKDVTQELQALGSITYDTRFTNTISSRVAGRIEKLFVKNRYQHIRKGNAVMDIYSPELNTAQQNLIFVLKNDAADTSLIYTAKEKLSLLGMSDYQLNELMHTQKIARTITVYSPYTGHVHEAANMNELTINSNPPQNASQLTDALSLKEGMYVQKGQVVFSVFNTEHAWAVLNIYANDQNLVKTGDAVTITPETAPGKSFKAAISFIEPFYKNGSKTLTARVYFNNVQEIPMGSQVKASIEVTIKNSDWLPGDAVLSLGLEKIVFLKVNGGFRAYKITTGAINESNVQVISGLSPDDEVAANAQFLMDSESFIKVNQ